MRPPRTIWNALRGELDFPDPSGTVLHAVLHALAGDFLLHQHLERAQRLEGAEVDVAPVHEGTQPLQQLRRQRHVTADRACPDERVALPVPAVRLVVLLQRVEAEHERPLAPERAQPHVYAVDEAVRGRFAEHLHELARELEKVTVVVDVAPAALGLPVLGEGEDEVDVGGEVQFARTELAQRQHDELLGFAGVADRGAEIHALPLVKPGHAGVDDRVGEIGGIAHRLVEIGKPADVPPGDPHHLPAAQPPETCHQRVDRFGRAGQRTGPLTQ